MDFDEIRNTRVPTYIMKYITGFGQNTQKCNWQGYGPIIYPERPKFKRRMKNKRRIEGETHLKNKWIYHDPDIYDRSPISTFLQNQKKLMKKNSSSLG